MTSDERDMDSQSQPITAADLRLAMAEKEAAKVDEAIKKRAEADRKLQQLFEEFMKAQVTEKELDAIRQKVLSATERGEMEAEIMRFPSKHCRDNGRAINNGEPDWPATLQGKARSLYDLFEERGRPRGFKLKAQILDFPGGLLGDVGLTLSWK